MANGGNRGWFPVVRQRESGGAQGKEVKHGLFTLFVDNLPAAMDAKTLSILFNQFGLVKDAFIPFKRRIVSNSRFGFVRFDCPVAADIAIQKANGLLVDERVLEVKKATNIKIKRAEQSRSRPQIIRRPLETNKNRDDVSFTGRRSFAEVLKGVTPTVAEKTRLIIKANEEGNGWLSDSAIVRLNSEYSTSSIENVLKEKGLDQVLVRKGGGRDIVLTFKSQEELKSNICNIKEWFKNWSQSVVEWKPGVYLEQERCVWLRCYGLPISLWNRGTLNNIGSLWGTVLSLDDDICQPKSFSHTRIKVATSSMEIINKNIFLECKGKLHPILVCEEHLADCSIMKHGGLEECSSNEICGSGVERTIPEGCYRKNEGKSVMEVNTVVEESKCNGVFSGEGEACPNEVEQRSGPSDCHLGEQVNTVVEESVMEESMHSPKINVEQAFTPGFPRGCSGSRDGYGPGINLEVDLAQALSMNLNGKDFLSVNHSGSGRQLASAPKLLRYEKKKSKKKVQLEGFSSFARLHRHKAATISKPTSKSVIFRPAAAAIARSDLSEDVTSPSNLLLNEAKATLQLGNLEVGVEPLIKLKGYILGNPLTHEHDDPNSRVEFAHRLALISDGLYESTKTNCHGEYLDVDPNNAPCIKGLQLVTNCLYNIDLGNILEPNCELSSPHSTKLKYWDRSLIEENPLHFLLPPSQDRKLWCRVYNYVLSDIWANDERVQKALHIRKGSIKKWVRCNKTLSYNEDLLTSIEYHRNLSHTDLRSLIYSGDHDMAIPYVGTHKWIDSLALPVDEDWRPWFVDGQVGGYTMKYVEKGFHLTFATVKGAGHTAPEYKPKECLPMLQRWLAYYNL